LRPHVYSRYAVWRQRFGAEGAIKLIKHEVAHLAAFKELCEHEGITDEVCLKFGETFDAAMSDEAWVRLKGALQAMRDDRGDDDGIVKMCRAIEDPTQAEEFTQMKGALAAIVHPSGQVLVSSFFGRATTDHIQMAIQVCPCSTADPSTSRQLVFACKYACSRGERPR
jgi:hypothetical protein